MQSSVNFLTRVSFLSTLGLRWPVILKVDVENTRLLFVVLAGAHLWTPMNDQPLGHRILLRNCSNKFAFTDNCRCRSTGESVVSKPPHQTEEGPDQGHGQADVVHLRIARYVQHSAPPGARPTSVRSGTSTQSVVGTSAPGQRLPPRKPVRVHFLRGE